MGKMNFSLKIHQTTLLGPEIPLFFLVAAKAGQGSRSLSRYVGHNMGNNGWACFVQYLGFTC